MNADFSNLAEPAQTQSLTDTITALVQRMHALEAEAAAIALEAETVAAAYAKLTQVEIPEVMGTLTEIKLADGSVLKVKPDLKASVSEANRAAAWAYLREHGHGAVIRPEEVIDLRGLDDKKRAKLLETLDKAGVTHESTETVHPQTLKALCKELLEKGTTLPPCFSIFQYKKAAVTTPKGRK